jgi:hypothetical protein
LAAELERKSTNAKIAACKRWLAQPTRLFISAVARTAATNMAAKPIVLDLYCSAGGVSRALSALDIPHVGVDIQDYADKYSGEFVQADASMLSGLEHVLADRGFPTSYPLVWASPPCLAYTPLSHVNASRYGWDETPKERYPTIPELGVRRVCEYFGDEYIIENVAHCDDLWNPIELNGHAFGLDIEARHKFETSFEVFSALDTGETVVQFGKHNNREKLAQVKDVPSEWTLEEINSAVPREYVQYLVHYCPSVSGVGLPEMSQAKFGRYMDD